MQLLMLRELNHLAMAAAGSPTAAPTTAKATTFTPTSSKLVPHPTADAKPSPAPSAASGGATYTPTSCVTTTYTEVYLEEAAFVFASNGLRVQLAAPAAERGAGRVTGSVEAPIGDPAVL